MAQGAMRIYKPYALDEGHRPGSLPGSLTILNEENAMKGIEGVV